MKPRFFASPGEFRRWLEKNHAKADELHVGYHKVHTGKPSMTWAQSVDEALCFGWIDGVRRRIDEDSYTIRFTPRRTTSIWSTVNLKRIEELKAAGRVAPAGVAAHATRDPKRAKVYATDNRDVVFDEATLAAFRAKRRAWAFFESQPPSFRRIATHWIMSAKRPETKAKRLKEIVDNAAKGQRPPAFTKWG